MSCSYDFWLDAATKTLVEGQVLGTDIFDTTDIIADKLWDPSSRTIQVGDETFAMVPELGVSGGGFLTHDIVRSSEI